MSPGFQLRVPPLIVAALAVFGGSCLDIVVKYAALQHALLGLLFWRFLVAGLALSTAFFTLGRRPLGVAATGYHLIRGVVHSLAAGTFFYGLTQISVAEATVIGFLAVLILPFLAWAFLGDRPRRLAVLAALVGFAGVALIQLGGSPDGETAATGHVLLGRLSCLAASIFYALSLVMLQVRAKLDDDLTIAAYSNVMPALWFAGPALFFAPPLDPSAAPWIVVLAILGTLVWVLMAWAYRHAAAQHIGPVEYTALVWASIFGFAVFGEVPSISLLAGAALIITACLILVFDDRQAKPAPASALIGDGAD